MTFEDMMAAAPQLVPLLPRLQKAFATFERVKSDPDVQDAIDVFREADSIIEKSKAKSPER